MFRTWGSYLSMVTITLTEDLEKIFPLDLKNLKLNSSKYSFLMNDKLACMMI
jgi:hypothetical protein